MIPGPDQVVACPYCKGRGKYSTLISGNTLGTRIWTDSKRVSPMLPNVPAVVRCSHCGRCYWLADAEEVDSIEIWQIEPTKQNAAWNMIEFVEEPSEAEYYQVIQAGLATNRQRERNLRVLAWWRSNDSFRDVGYAAPSLEQFSSPERDENLLALLLLLDESDENDLLMKAEVYRELRMWEEAQQVLTRITSVDYSAIVSQIEALCQSKDAFVRELHFGI